MCIRDRAYSGRCLLSAYLTGRDANRGGCAQPCRWKYRIVEPSRPDRPLTAEEDETDVYTSQPLERAGRNQLSEEGSPARTLRACSSI